MLVERFCHRSAYLMVAGGFTAVGLLAALIVRIKEHEVAPDAHAGKTIQKMWRQMRRRQPPLKWRSRCWALCSAALGTFIHS